MVAMLTFGKAMGPFPSPIRILFPFQQFVTRETKTILFRQTEVRLALFVAILAASEMIRTLPPTVRWKSFSD
jgi:hypothetical protein